MRIILLCPILLMLTVPAPAAEFVVDTQADSVDIAAGDGLCADDLGRCSLRAAVQETNALPGMDRIRLADGSFVFSIAGRAEDLAATGDLDVTDAVEIIGNGRDSSIIDANGLDTVMEIHPDAAEVRLQALTLRNGRYEITADPTPCSTPGCGAGGLINSPGVEIALHNVAFRDHRGSYQAGAIFNRGGCIRGDYVIISGSRPQNSDTSPAAAGAIASEGDGACLELDQSELADNEGNWAGAIMTADTHLVIQRSLMRNNRGLKTGAFSFFGNSQALLENVTITGNEGGMDGALLNDGGSIVHIRNSTITDNRGTLTGGITDVHAGFGLVTLSNTLLTGNHSDTDDPDCQRGLNSNGGLVIGQAVGSEPLAGGCWVNEGPQDVYELPLVLGPLADHGGATLSMLPPPEAVDTGVAAECAETDQRGVTRPQGAGCDRGAVELIAPSLTFDPTNLDFGDVDEGTVSEPQSATVHNPGGVVVDDLNFSLSGDNGFVTDTGDCGTTLPAGETCQVTVTFAPLNSGPSSARLEAIGAGGSSAGLDLEGNGVTDPKPPEDGIFMDRFRQVIRL